ncbi:MAG: hypothetical protein E7580_08995 [Ruminococcaceae bacterium]|nr:hypothetical protein [Oscillospiraceae bacterium]
MSKMKRKMFFVAVILFVFLFSACAQEESQVSTTLPSETAGEVSDKETAGKASDDGDWKILFEGKGYVVLDTGLNPDGSYLYRIFDQNGKVVREDRVFRPPQISHLSETAFGVRISYGTGFSTAKTFYYDTKTDQMTEDFSCVLTQTDSRIVCADMEQLIVRSIFDESYYCEIKDFQNSPAKIEDIPFQKAEFTQDEKGVTVTYLTGEYDPKKDLYPYRVTETIIFEAGAFKLEWFSKHIEWYVGNEYFPKEDVPESLGVIDSPQTAKEKGMAVLKKLYGEETLKDEEPFGVSFDEENQAYLIQGTLPDNMVGGVAHILIQKTDGKVIAVWHDK